MLRKMLFWPAVAVVAASIGIVGILKGSALLVLLPIAAIVLGGLSLEHYETISADRSDSQSKSVKRSSA
jgi:hypothetical protein